LHQSNYRFFRLLQIPGFLISGGFLVLYSNFLPALAAFQKTPASRIESCTLRLSHAPEIPHQCLKYVDKSVQLFFWQTSLGFQFGRLSRTQWQILSQHYSSWHHHRTPYNSLRNYDLLDFLPPVIQALDRHRFISETRSLSPVSDRQLVTNCWGTTYEILRLSQRSTLESPVLFVTKAQPMLNLLRRISTPITTTIQPGDVLLVSHRHGNQEYLDHTAIAIDQQIVFEKAGTGRYCTLSIDRPWHHSTDLEPPSFFLRVAQTHSRARVAASPARILGKQSSSTNSLSLFNDLSYQRR
jgi:hypothetical protein